jgi:peptidoglycan/LPS O-acetylase OafA/YrhL
MQLSVQGRGARYRPDIDGLRAVAVAGVLAFHAFPEAIPGGFVGVDVFFVVSGYLISGIVWRALGDGSFSLGDFYARRVRRIFPALAVVLAASLVAGWFTLLPLEYARLGKHALAGATFASNFVLWGEAGYFDKAAELKPLLHLWSLAIEEQFYLVWPLMLLAARRLRLSLLSVAVTILLASFVANVLTVSTRPDAAFYAPWTRVWELALGAVMVRATARAIAPAVRSVAAIAGALVVVGAMFVLDRSSAFPGWAALLPTIGTCLVLLAGQDAWLNRHVLASRALVFVGLISYPLYLWHWPLLSFARLLSLETPPVAIRVAALALSVIAAWGTYALLEQPIRAGRGGARVAVWLAGAIATLGALGLLVLEGRGLAFRIAPPLRQYVSFDYDMNADVNLACWRSASEPGYPDACLDAGKPGPVVFLWGDSHAARLSAGMRRVLGDDARMAEYTRSSCPPILGHGAAPCQAANAFVLGKVRESRPDVVVLSANWIQHGQAWAPNDDVARLLEQTLGAITAAGAGLVVVIGPVPQWRDDLPRVLAKATFRDVPRHRVPRRMTFGLEPVVFEADAALATLLAKREGVTYVSPSRLLCSEEGCLTRVDDEADGLMTWDYGHLTTKGATYLVRAIAAAHPRALLSPR